MNVVIGQAPEPRSTGRYEELYRVIRTNAGKWISVQMDKKAVTRTAGALHAARKAGAFAGQKLEVAQRGDRLYAKLSA